jgi:hypothetical protein
LVRTGKEDKKLQEIYAGVKLPEKDYRSAYRAQEMTNWSTKRQ